MKKIAWYLFAFFSIAIGLYPLLFVGMDMRFNLLDTKPESVFQNQFWKYAFYGHVVFGGLSLLVGWSQFSSALRAKRMNLHRTLGKLYVIFVLLSGLSVFLIAPYITGDWITQAGFVSLGVLWLLSTGLAYFTIKKGDVQAHQKWMIYSFALSWAAVTLRLYLPILTMGFRMPFLDAYRIIAWLCWVPNLFVAAYITGLFSGRK